MSFVAIVAYVMSGLTIVVVNKCPGGGRESVGVALVVISVGSLLHTSPLGYGFWVKHHLQDELLGCPQSQQAAVRMLESSCLTPRVGKHCSTGVSVSRMFGQSALT